MDYPAGSLTFSPARLIRRDQRVEVSCYREGDGFRRGWPQGGSGPGRLADGALQVFPGGGRHRVSPGIRMSPEAEEVLRNAGENPGDAWLDGASYVGKGRDPTVSTAWDDSCSRAPAAETGQLPSSDLPLPWRATTYTIR